MPVAVVHEQKSKAHPRPKHRGRRVREPRLAGKTLSEMALARFRDKSGWRIDAVARRQIEWLVGLRLRPNFADLGHLRSADGGWLAVPETSDRLLRELAAGSTAWLDDLARLYDLWLRHRWRAPDSTWPGP